MNWYEIKAVSDEVAEIWIYDEIGEDWFGEGLTAKAFVEEIGAIKAPAIDLHINSPGGSVFDGQAIYNAIQRHPAKVTSYIDWLAASIASTIALAGDKVVMAANALFMIHQPWGLAMGPASEMRSMADVLDKIAGTLVAIYAAKSSKDEADIMSAMDAETWYTAAEAAEYGFVDEVGDEMKLAARFDLEALGKFRHPPKMNTIPSGGGAPPVEPPVEVADQDEPAPPLSYPRPI